MREEDRKKRKTVKNNERKTNDRRYTSQERKGTDLVFFFSGRRRHTSSGRDWSSDVCSSDLVTVAAVLAGLRVSKALLLIAEYRNKAGEAGRDE